MKHKITLFALLGTTLGFSQDYSGRVGINTETPNATLEVKGSPNDIEVSWMRDSYFSFFGRMFEMMMTSIYRFYYPAILFNQSY